MCSRFVLNMVEVVEARIVLKMFFFWANNRGCSYKKRRVSVVPSYKRGHTLTTRGLLIYPVSRSDTMQCISFQVISSFILRSKKRKQCLIVNYTLFYRHQVFPLQASVLSLLGQIFSLVIVVFNVVLKFRPKIIVFLSTVMISKTSRITENHYTPACTRLCG